MKVLCQQGGPCLLAKKVWVDSSRVDGEDNVSSLPFLPLCLLPLHVVVRKTSIRTNPAPSTNPPTPTPTKLPTAVGEEISPVIPGPPTEVEFKCMLNVVHVCVMACLTC